MKKFIGMILMVLAMVSAVFAESYIQVMCEPGIKILLDGTLKGMSNADDGGLIIEQVTPGRHTIKAVRTGFAPQEDELMVDAGAVKVYQLRRFVQEVQVSQAGAAAGGAIEQQSGTLMIQSLPVGCEIAVSGTAFSERNAQRKTQDKWTAKGISAGKHVVSATARGKTLRYEIDMVSQGMVHLFFNFMTGQVEVRAETKPKRVIPAVVATVTQQARPKQPNLTLAQQLEKVETRELALQKELKKISQTLANPPASMKMADMTQVLNNKKVLGSQLADVRQEKARLLVALKNREKNRFNREYAEYRLIAESAELNDALKSMAWKEICATWKVISGGTPGQLVWNEAKGGAEIFVQPEVKMVDFGSGVKMELMPISAGRFLRDNNSNVTLSKPFWMTKTEVTQAQYKQIMGSNPSSFQGSNNPVEKVSWNDAVSFCKKLTQREQQAGRLPAGFEYTLPTEAQWEYACRAGTTGKYAGDLDAMGWYSANSGKKTHPVGTKQANAWGLFDMHGNVWEWCRDGYGDYPSGNVTDPGGAGSGSDRVLRGGSWFNYAGRCRSAHRNGNDPSNAYGNLGFRVCLVCK